MTPENEPESTLFCDALREGWNIAHHYLNTSNPREVAQWAYQFAEATVELVYGAPDTSEEETLGKKSTMG